MRLTNHLKGFLLILPLVLAAGAVPASAQTAGPAKIAVIDVELILTDSARGQQALKEIDALRKDKAAQVKTKGDEINDLRQRIQDGQLSLAQDRLQAMAKELEDKTIALQRFQDDATRELSKKRDEVLDAIEKSVFPVINQIGQEGGYTAIFNKFRSGLVYADEAVDITQQVIERYNQVAPPAGG